MDKQPTSEVGLNLLRQLVTGHNALRDLDVFACNSREHPVNCQCFWEQCEAWAKADAEQPASEVTAEVGAAACPVCKGKGSIPTGSRPNWRSCPNCSGHGEVTAPVTTPADERPEDLMQWAIECRDAASKIANDHNFDSRARHDHKVRAQCWGSLIRELTVRANSPASAGDAEAIYKTTLRLAIEIAKTSRRSGNWSSSDDKVADEQRARIVSDLEWLLEGKPVAGLTPPVQKAVEKFAALCTHCHQPIHYQPMAGWYHVGGKEYYPEPDCNDGPVDISLMGARAFQSRQQGVLMAKLVLLFSIFLTFSEVNAQESTHSQNVNAVTNLYWSYLNRPPDIKGLQFWVFDIDFNEKSHVMLAQAFHDSSEYQNRKGDLICNADYTKLSAAVRTSKPVELIQIRGQFIGRALVGSELDPLTAVFGNVIIFQTADCKYRLWFDYAALGDSQALDLISHLVASNEIAVTFDPVSGLATNISVISFQVPR